MRYVLGFLAAFAVSALVTPVIARLARRGGAVDIPLAEPRKRHPRPTPLLGGTAIFFSVTAVTLFVLSFTDLLPAPFLSLRQIAALTIGGAILIAGGALDARYRLKPSRQIVFPALAAAIAVLGGVSIDYVRNPFGGQIALNLLTVSVFRWVLCLPPRPPPSLPPCGGGWLPPRVSGPPPPPPPKTPARGGDPNPSAPRMGFGR